MAPDRGFIGNQEIRSVFDDFKKSYAASLALIGRDYNGVDGEYSGYLSRALLELKQAGATHIVAIPLFPSMSDPVLQKVIAYLPTYPDGGNIEWTAPMAESYLVGQILLDRVEAVSQDSEQERLIVIGIGAMDDASETALKADLDKLLAHVTRRKRFREVRAVVYYDREARSAEDKNKAVDTEIMGIIAKKGRTIAVPTTIGLKFDQHMGLTAWIGRKFSELNIVYLGDELLPHPNVLLWVKKTANAYVPAVRNEIGVVIMPHGATQPWNDAVERVIAPLTSRYRIEMAYGMGDSGTIQQAVSTLESEGIRRIVFVRMYALTQHMKDRTDYILGLSPAPPAHDHDLPGQIRSAALFLTFGGYEENPAIAEILHERIIEVSKDPLKERVILLAHGEKTEEGNARWLSIMNANIQRLRQDPHCAKLKGILAATAREDWPEQRGLAIAEVRKIIAERAQDERVLVIADRLYGSGPYKKLLADLDYVLNENELVHPIITRWLEDGIGRATALLSGPLDGVDRVTQQ